jgi:hypothetical protein
MWHVQRAGSTHWSAVRTRIFNGQEISSRSQFGQGVEDERGKEGFRGGRVVVGEP